MLAGFVIAAAKQRNHKILLLFDGFCFPECPEQCLQFITWLMLGVNNTESPTAPIRLITLNFNPGPRVPPQLKQIVRTHPESLSWPEIREQCLTSNFTEGSDENVEIGELARLLRVLTGLYEQAARSATSL